MFLFGKKKPAPAPALEPKPEPKKKAPKREFSDFIYTPEIIYDNISDDVAEDDAVSFIQEPDNPYDSNAVKVMWKRSKTQLGYLYKGRTQKLINEALTNGWSIRAKIDFLDDPEKDKTKWICISGSVAQPDE